MKNDYHKNLDISDYPVDNDYMIPRVNKKILRMMKDENNSRTISHFTGLHYNIYMQLHYTPAELERERSRLKGKEIRKHGS